MTGRPPDERLSPNERIHSRHVWSEIAELARQFRNALEPETGQLAITRAEFTSRVDHLLAMLLSERRQHGEGGDPDEQSIMGALAGEVSRYRIAEAARMQDRLSEHLRRVTGEPAPPCT